MYQLAAFSDMAEADTDTATENAELPPTPHSPTTFSVLPDGKPWVTIIAIAICVLIFAGVNLGKSDSWDSLFRWGYLSSENIWRGSYWGLVTSGFVHIAIWHLVFNVTWLWALGSRMEVAIGSLPYLLFILLATAISSAGQLAVSGHTGHGASGFLYAIFGFMWMSRDRFPSFQAVLNDQTVKLFLIWLVGCIAITYLDIVSIGNGAHVFGLLFGMAIARSFASDRWRQVARAGLGALTVCSVMPLFWCPWSTGWLSIKAYDAHAKSDYFRAVDLYSQILRSEPENAWALYNRGLAYEVLGQDDEAQADKQKAVLLDPSYKDAE